MKSFRKFNHALIKAIFIILIFNANASIANTTTSVDGKLRSIPLIEIKNTNSNSGWKELICKHPDSDCKKTVPVLLKPKFTSSKSSIFYVTYKNKLIFQKIERISFNSWRILNSWNLSVFNEDSTSNNADLVTSIYPALYPISPTEWAVALTTSLSEMYSGGGANFTTADFILLKSDKAVKAVSGIPFSCSKMVRACFGENDYKYSKHCHDESIGNISLKIIETKKTTFDWNFSWNQVDWAANTAASGKKRTQHSFTIDPLAELNPDELKKIGFCGGPV